MHLPDDWQGSLGSIQFDSIYLNEFNSVHLLSVQLNVQDHPVPEDGVGRSGLDSSILPTRSSQVGGAGRQGDREGSLVQVPPLSTPACWAG